MGDAECMLSMARSKWMRALLTAVETGVSISGGASRRSSSSSSGMMVAGEHGGEPVVSHPLSSPAARNQSSQNVG